MLGVKRKSPSARPPQTRSALGATADISVTKEGVGADIPATYVPARKTIFLSLRFGWAEAAGARASSIGGERDRFSGYPDCGRIHRCVPCSWQDIATKAGVEGAGRFAVQAAAQYMNRPYRARRRRGSGLEAGLSW